MPDEELNTPPPESGEEEVEGTPPEGGAEPESPEAEKAA